MFLVWLLKNVVYRLICGNVEISVRDIIYDSRNDVEDCVFVCLKGFSCDGHDYAAEVMGRNARAVVIQDDLLKEHRDALRELAWNKGICLISVSDTRQALSEMSRAFFHYPEKKLTMIGITGTKGKTTSAGLLKSILDAANIPAGLMGTLGIFTGKHHFDAMNTTPESYLVQKYLRMMVDDGCKAAIMEVSSQALMCGRVAGVFFDYGVLTNISPDHIGPGEHHSFEEYRYWKGRLFSQCHIGIANGNDDNVKEALAGCSCCVETFGVCEDDVPCAQKRPCTWEAAALEAVLEPEPGTRFLVFCKGASHGCTPRAGAPRGCESVGGAPCGCGRAPLFLSLPGAYNVCNALAPIAVARHMGVSWDAIRRGLASVKVPGRCEVLARVRGGYFILDYAHNGKALETILSTLRQYKPRRLICIFGCGGNRSRLRRTDMARAAAYGADRLIITTDNPRYEPPLEIIRDIESEILRLSKNDPALQKENFYTIIEDRREAIGFAINLMEPGDIVLLAGKGHETYQEIAGKKYPFDEHQIVRELLSGIGAKSL